MSWKSLFLVDLSPAPPEFSLGGDDGGRDPGAVLGDSEPLDESSPGAGRTEPLSADVEANADWFRKYFVTSVSTGLVLRPVQLATPPVDGLVIYLDDQVNWEHLNRTVLAPLLSAAMPPETARSPRVLTSRVITEGRVLFSDNRVQLADWVMRGNAVLLVAGSSEGIAFDVKGWAKRSVERPTTEMTVRGPQEAFAEDIITNLSLVRRRLRTPGLMVEWTQLGRLSQTDVVLLYLSDVANPKLIKEIRRRIKGIDVDYLSDTGDLEGLLEDRPFSIYPNFLATERPDRVAAQLAEGYIAILVAGGANGLILPAHVPMFLQSPEDVYLRWPYATFIRIVRILAFFMAQIVPGLYVAVASFHQEMIPTALMLAISRTREAVPLPLVAEVFVMELMFELIREAGVRIPTMIGPTIGIVGALILGQAAVQANVISPIIVIITSATALASFTIPNYSLQYATRLMRFIYIVAGAFMGLFGITMVFLAISLQQASKNVMGAPWLSPVTPRRSWIDTVLRFPQWAQNKRPRTVRPQNSRRQAEHVRPWDPHHR